MPKALRPSELVPTGLAVESAVVEGASMWISRPFDPSPASKIDPAY